MKSMESGFEEIPHIADWSIHVWAKDLPGLFEQAALGMYSMAGVTHSEGAGSPRTLELRGSDTESLLISFLSEIVYLMEHERLIFEEFKIQFEGTELKAAMIGWKIDSIRKAFKAVTYHNLKIRRGKEGYQVDIVFDV